MTFTERFTKIVDYFRRPESSAKVAKERLQIIIAHERTERDASDYLPLMQKDLLEVISKYVAINKDHIKFDILQKDGCSILELNVTLPK